MECNQDTTFGLEGVMESGPARITSGAMYRGDLHTHYEYHYNTP